MRSLRFEVAGQVRVELTASLLESGRLPVNGLTHSGLIRPDYALRSCWHNDGINPANERELAVAHSIDFSPQLPARLVSPAAARLAGPDHKAVQVAYALLGYDEFVILELRALDFRAAIARRIAPGDAIFAHSKHSLIRGEYGREWRSLLRLNKRDA